MVFTQNLLISAIKICLKYLSRCSYNNALTVYSILDAPLKYFWIHCELSRIKGSSDKYSAAWVSKRRKKIGFRKAQMSIRIQSKRCNLILVRNIIYYLSTWVLVNLELKKKSMLLSAVFDIKRKNEIIWKEMKFWSFFVQLGIWGLFHKKIIWGNDLKQKTQQ